MIWRPQPGIQGLSPCLGEKIKLQMTTASIPNPVGFDHNLYLPMCVLKAKLAERTLSAGGSKGRFLCEKTSI